MEKIKLIEILYSLTPHEFKEFGKFINSPFFNESQKISGFYEELKLQYPNNLRVNQIKDKCYKILYPGEKYNDKKFRDLCSQMVKHAEDFIGYYYLKNNKFELDRYSLSQISKRNLDKLFESKLRDIRKLIDKIKYKDNVYYFYEYLLQKEKRQYYEIKKPTGKRIIHMDELRRESVLFVRYFLVKILKYFVMLLRDEKFLQFKYKLDFTDHTIDYIRENSFDDVPVVIIFVNLILLIRKIAGDKEYFETKELVLKNIEFIDKNDLRVIFGELHYYAVEKIHKGEKSFNNENFSIILKMLEHDAYPREEGFMNELMFIDIVKAGLREEKYEWTEKFIEDYIGKIDAVNKTNTKIFCEALINYYQKNFVLAKKFANRINPKDFYFHIFKKTLLIKIFYSLGEFDEIINLIKSFKQLLEYDKAVPEELKLRYGKFIEHMRKITAAKIKNDEISIRLLTKKIEETEKIKEFEWIEMQ